MQRAEDEQGKERAGLHRAGGKRLEHGEAHYRKQKEEEQCHSKNGGCRWPGAERGQGSEKKQKGKVEVYQGVGERDWWKGNHGGHEKDYAIEEGECASAEEKQKRESAREQVVG